MSDVHLVDPLVDPRWDAFVASHPHASAFHSRGWLQALQQTYGYEPFALTTTKQGALENGLVACRVRTWLARRVVSLPFADHCEPLVSGPSELEVLTGRLREEATAGRARAVEIRPRTAKAFPGLTAGPSYCLHMLDLARPLARIFDGFDASNTRRAVRRAEREGLTYECGRSEMLVSQFFDLLRLTRRRHAAPPQPRAWFRNLVANLREALEIHVARKGTQPIAAMLTLTSGRTMVYKYGGSDASQHRLGGVSFLFWQVIQSAHARGLEALDLGRSDFDQPGLIAFKDHLGATRSTLTYYCAPSPQSTTHAPSTFGTAARALLIRLPDPMFDLAGRLAYRHLG